MYQRGHTKLDVWKKAVELCVNVLDTQIEIANRLGYVIEETKTPLTKELKLVNSLVEGVLKYLRRKNESFSQQ